MHINSLLSNVLYTLISKRATRKIHSLKVQTNHFAADTETEIASICVVGPTMVPFWPDDGSTGIDGATVGPATFAATVKAVDEAQHE